MRRNRWVQMMLLVPLLAQVAFVAPAGACSMSGPARVSSQAAAHGLNHRPEQTDHGAMEMVHHPAPVLHAGDSPDARHMDPAAQHMPDCCTGAESGDCSGVVCQMGGCAAAYLLSAGYEITIPLRAPHPVFHSVFPQPLPLFAPFRPPIA